MKMVYRLKKKTKDAITTDRSLETTETSIYLYEHQIQALKDLSGDGSYNALLRNIITDYLGLEAVKDRKEKSEEKAGTGDSSKEEGSAHVSTS